MRTVVFSSGGPGNFKAAVELSAEAPSLIQVNLLVTDRTGTASAGLAQDIGIPKLALDFDDVCRERPDGEAPEARREAFHDRMLNNIEAFERQLGAPLDFGVLAYRRLVTGRLLARFDSRLINQHPADLSIMDQRGARLYTGISGLRRSLEDRRGGARTTTMLVDEGLDTGEIISRGPYRPLDGDPDDATARETHEQRQKRQSDWPSLKFALAAIASGALERSMTRPYRFFLEGEPVSPSGVPLTDSDAYRRFIREN